MKVELNREAWDEGYRAPKGAPCPYPPRSTAALSWASGQIEGIARRERERGAPDKGAPHQAGDNTGPGGNGKGRAT
jgi:hypothetical protein